MMRKLRALMALCLCLMTGSARALTFPVQTANEDMVRSYLEEVNAVLNAQGASEINSVFECYDTLIVAGVTAMPDSDSVENVEISVSMGSGGLDSLELSVCDTSAFAPLAAALTSVAAGEPEKVRQYLSDPSAYASRVAKNPLTSFSDTVHYEKGATVRTYYLYEPNTFGDGRNWLTLVLIFPRRADARTGIVETPVPHAEAEPVRDGSDDDGDYTPYDEGTHLEIFTTPTPEPDSAAGEGF